jgi:hypothetical protein
MSPRQKDDDMPATCALHTQELQRIGKTVDDIHKRLFVDNGEPCLQSKVRRIDGIIGAVVWVLGVVTTALIGVVIKGWGSLK